MVSPDVEKKKQKKTKTAKSLLREDFVSSSQYELSIHILVSRSLAHTGLYTLFASMSLSFNARGKRVCVRSFECVRRDVSRSCATPMNARLSTPAAYGRERVFAFSSMARDGNFLYIFFSSNEHRCRATPVPLVSRMHPTLFQILY